MTKQPSEQRAISDDALLHILKQHTPSPWLSHDAMEKFEATILAQTAHRPRTSFFDWNLLFIWFVRGWTPRAAALVALLATIGGFIVGQVSGGMDFLVPASDPAPMTMADTSPYQTDLIDTMWSDSDDDDAQ